MPIYSLLLICWKGVKSMSLATTIDKVIIVIKSAIIGIAPAAVDYTLCKGVYDNDQQAFSAYPVICVGVPSDVDETFPVIAQHSARDEQYTIKIIAYVKFEDTAANTRSIITLTEAIRAAIRADMKPPLEPLDGDAYQGDLDKSNFGFTEKGDISLRASVTIVRYIQRIVV